MEIDHLPKTERERRRLRLVHHVTPAHVEPGPMWTLWLVLLALALLGIAWMGV